MFNLSETAVLNDKEMGDVIRDSSAWMLIYYNKDGTHLRSPSIEEGCFMISTLLGNNPELWDAVKKMVWEIKKGH